MPSNMNSHYTHTAKHHGNAPAQNDVDVNKTMHRYIIQYVIHFLNGFELAKTPHRSKRRHFIFHFNQTYIEANGKYNS